LKLFAEKICKTCTCIFWSGKVKLFYPMKKMY